MVFLLPKSPGRFVRGGDFTHSTSRIVYGPCGLNSLTHSNNQGTLTCSSGDVITNNRGTLLFRYEPPKEDFAEEIWFRAVVVRRYGMWTTVFEGKVESHTKGRNKASGAMGRYGASRAGAGFSLLLAVGFYLQGLLLTL